MKVSLQFFHETDWSILATCKVFLLVSLFWIFKIPLTPVNLIFASIIGMMSGSFVDKLTLVFFLCMLTRLGSTNFFSTSFWILLASGIVFLIPDDNVVFQFFQTNSVARFLVLSSVVVWMVYFTYLLLKFD